MAIIRSEKLALLGHQHKRPLRLGSLLVVYFALFCSCAWSQSLVIEHVTVIDATGHAARPDVTVIVDQDHIVAVVISKKAHIPKSAKVVNGVSKFLIPGLWDMHVHGASDARAAWSHLLFVARDEWEGPQDVDQQEFVSIQSHVVLADIVLRNANAYLSGTNCPHSPATASPSRPAMLQGASGPDRVLVNRSDAWYSE